MPKFVAVPGNKPPWVNSYTESIARRICEAVAAGASLADIAELPWSPGLWQLYTWLAEYPDFAEAHKLARQAHADTLAAETLRIADESVDIEKDKLRIDTRRWIASKLHPAEFGDRRAVDVTSTSTSIVKVINKYDVSHMSLDELHEAERLLDLIIAGQPIEDGDGDGGDADDDED